MRKKSDLSLFPRIQNWHNHVRIKFWVFLAKMQSSNSTEIVIPRKTIQPIWISNIFAKLQMYFEFISQTWRQTNEKKLKKNKRNGETRAIKKFLSWKKNTKKCRYIYLYECVRICAHLWFDIQKSSFLLLFCAHHLESKTETEKKQHSVDFF